MQSTALTAKNRGNRRSDRAQRTRRDILDAAGRLFSERGFATTTMREIAQSVGITDAAIYYHFPTKRDLLEKLLETDFTVASCGDYASPNARAPLSALVERIVDRAIESVRAKECLLRIVVREALAGNALARRRYRELMDAWEKDVASAIWTAGRDRRFTECRWLAREIVFTTTMAIEDTLFFGRGACRSPEKKWRELRRFLVRDLADVAMRAKSPPQETRPSGKPAH